MLISNNKIMKNGNDLYLELVYNKVLNFLILIFKIKWVYIFVLVFTSCSVQNVINKDYNKTIPKSFSANFYDKLDTLNNNYDNRVFTRSLVKDFSNVDNIDYSEPIHIQILNDELYLNFLNTNKKSFVLRFYGKLHKRKFVFYTNYETVSFPILFISKEMTKYSIYLSDDDEVIFENHNVNEGMLLMFGAGNSSKSNYKFKIIKNE